MSIEALPPLRGGSKRQQVFEAIQNALVAGKLKPGQRLIELELAAQMQVGSPTIREALIDLEHLGFVTRIPNRGTFVTNLTEEDIVKIYNLREVLELYAIRLGRARATSANLKPLRSSLKAMRDAAEAGDRLTFYQADVSFHRGIWELADNKHLMKTLEMMSGPLLADVVTRHPGNSKSLLTIVASHEAMMNCLTKVPAEEIEGVIHNVFEALRRGDQKMYALPGQPEEAAQPEGSRTAPVL